MSWGFVLINTVQASATAGGASAVASALARLRAAV
jgi:hypothetical protein